MDHGHAGNPTSGLSPPPQPLRRAGIERRRNRVILEYSEGGRRQRVLDLYILDGWACNGCKDRKSRGAFGRVCFFSSRFVLSSLDKSLFVMGGSATAN